MRCRMRRSHHSISWSSRWRVLEDAAHQEALHLHGEEGLKDSPGIKVQALGEGIGSGGAQNLDPTLNDIVFRAFFCDSLPLHFRWLAKSATGRRSVATQQAIPLSRSSEHGPLGEAIIEGGPVASFVCR